LLYVSKQLGHAKPTTTLDHYAKWLPSGEQRFVDLLDTQLENIGTRSWHQVDKIEEKDAEVVKKFCGPCRGRTYGPLIKSEAEGVAQVLDGLGNPLVIAMQYAVDQYSQFVSTCRSSTGFVALPNTVLTPEGGYRPNG
jgi:hypothetical protein